MSSPVRILEEEERGGEGRRGEERGGEGRRGEERGGEGRRGEERGGGEQGSRGAGEQGSRGAGEQGRSAKGEERGSKPLPPGELREDAVGLQEDLLFVGEPCPLLLAVGGFLEERPKVGGGVHDLQ